MRELNLQSYCLFKHGGIAIGVNWEDLYLCFNLFTFNSVKNSTFQELEEDKYIQNNSSL
jgi:hypothetical protein